jgi:hypothetical protein
MQERAVPPKWSTDTHVRARMLYSRQPAGMCPISWILKIRASSAHQEFLIAGFRRDNAHRAKRERILHAHSP